jgi:hypothetical protein
MGKIAAHAYVDELQRLNLGYEIAVEKTAVYLKEAGSDKTARTMFGMPTSGDELKQSYQQYFLRTSSKPEVLNPLTNWRFRKLRGDMIERGFPVSEWEREMGTTQKTGGYGQVPQGMDPAAWAAKMKNFKSQQAQNALTTGVNSLKKAIGQ